MNLKINIKRPQITKEEIAANKNFKEVLKMYKSASGGKTIPFYKSLWFYTGLSAAASVVIAIILYVAPTKNTAHAIAFISPPMEKVKISPSLYSVSAETGTTITYKTGSVIKIPPKSFVDKGGNPVYGKVDITYRELNDPIDFFLSGIPMNYDSAGTKYTFESAGMIEIHATQNGKELDFSPEKELNIAMASHQSGKPFNFYKLDTEKMQWIYQGREQELENKQTAANAGLQTADSGLPASLESPKLAALDSKLELTQIEIKKSEAIVKRLEAAKPYEPREETKGHNRFALNVKNIKDFPELALYKDVMFQATEGNNKFDEKAYNIDWRDATLSKKGDNYILTLRKDNTKASYIVHPVFEGEGYNMAQEIYKTKSKEYQKTLVESIAAESEKQQNLTALTEVIKDNRNAEVADIIKNNDELNKSHSSGATDAAGTAMVNPGNLTFHNFSIHSCGIWNLDNPTTLPEGAMVKGHFTDENGKELQFAAGKIYLVEKGRNILFSFEGNAPISYNPEKQNMIWGLTTDNKIAIFSYDDFKAMGKQSGDYTFKMKISDADLADEAQVEYYLNI